MRYRIRLAIGLSGLLCGCTTSLSVSEVADPPAPAVVAPTTATPSTDALAPAAARAPAGLTRSTSLTAGFPYFLPAAVITPTAYIAIRDCPVDEDLAKQMTSISPAKAKPVTEVTFVVGGSIPATQVADQMIVIDPRNLQKFMKTTSLGLERWPNGMLKAVNASIEDQTPQALAALAAAAGSVALLSTGAPAAGMLLSTAARPAPGGRPAPGAAPSTPALKSVSFLSCSPGTLELVKRRKAAAAIRETASGQLDKSSAAAATLGAQPAVDQARLDKLKAEVAKLSAQVDTATNELAAVDAMLTLPLDMVAPLAGGTAVRVPDTGQVAPTVLKRGAVFTSDKMQAFIDMHFINATAMLPPTKKPFDRRPCAWDDAVGAKIVDETCTGLDAIRAVLAKAAKVEIRDKTLRPVVEDAGDRRPATAALRSKRKNKDGTPGAEIAANEGIIYVEPAKLRLEMTTATIGPSSFINPRRVVKTADVSVPQLGRYMSLPVRAGFGERVEVKATFAEDGSLLTGSFSNPKTSGMALAELAKQLGTTAVSTRDAVEDRRLKLVKGQAEALAALASSVESAKKLTPTTDPLADINSQLAKLNVEAAIVEAELRIQSARAKLISP